ncbi:MAG TPA: rod shape-determining protein [Chloroflexota bacterium]|nr:rod shape-determining protein [Chloroflexota bacterium]HZU05777.1 rod shape-determining protein [Chloroflexota bacterium]
MFTKQVGIDLGTSYVRVYVRGRGLVLQEPTVVAYSATDERVLAVGREAREMEERAPPRIVICRPIRDGVIADYGVTTALLRHVLQRAVGRSPFVRPTVMVSIPAGVTNVESRAVLDATLQAGARQVYLIPAPLAAALGANIPIAGPSGNLLVHLGGGTCEAVVLSLNDIVVSSTIRQGGNRIDELIATFLKRKHNLIVGRHTAEDVKLQIGSALPLAENVSLEVKGVDQVTGLPRSVVVSSWEITEAISEALAAIVANVRAVLEQTPPELASDVVDKGMILTGGGALLRNLDKLLTREVGVPAYLADEPSACVAIGAGKALEHFKILRYSLLHAGG